MNLNDLDYFKELHAFITDLLNLKGKEIKILFLNHSFFALLIKKISCFIHLFSSICNVKSILGIYQAIFYCETLLTLCRFKSLENDASKADVLISRQQELIGNIFQKVIQFEKNIENYEINLQVSNLIFYYYIISILHADFFFRVRV